MCLNRDSHDHLSPAEVESLVEGAAPPGRINLDIGAPIQKRSKYRTFRLRSSLTDLLVKLQVCLQDLKVLDDLKLPFFYSLSDNGRLFVS